MADESKKARAIVSASHLVAEDMVGLSEFEYSLHTAANSYNRWVLKCMRAAGHPELTVIDSLMLHAIANKGRMRSTSDIGTIMNIDDSHVVIYSLRKLSKINAVVAKKSGKENFYTVTEYGLRICDAYRRVRDQCLVEVVEGDMETYAQMARFVRRASGLFDQAARAATTISDE